MAKQQKQPRSYTHTQLVEFVAVIDRAKERLETVVVRVEKLGGTLEVGKAPTMANATRVLGSFVGALDVASEAAYFEGATGEKSDATKRREKDRAQADKKKQS